MGGWIWDSFNLEFEIADFGFLKGKRLILEHGLPPS